MKKRAWLFALSLLLALPAAAQVTRGYASIELNLRAGPDIGYPVVDLIPTGAPLYVHGCTDDWAWCDVSLYDVRGWDERGWVAGDFIDYPYRDHWVSVYTYGPVIGIPVIRFVIGDYWFHHYRHHRFYRERDYWYHRRFADHDVPRYHHERRRLADGFLDRDRHDRDRYDHDGYRRYHRDGDFRDRHRDRMDRHERVADRRSDRREDRREDRRSDRRMDQRVHRRIDHRRRLAPTVARQAGLRNERALAHAPRRNLHPQRMNRYQPRVEHRNMSRSMTARAHAPRPAPASVQHHANRQHARHGKRHDNRRQHD